MHYHIPELPFIFQQDLHLLIYSHPAQPVRTKRKHVPWKKTPPHPENILFDRLLPENYLIIDRLSLHLTAT